MSKEYLIKKKVKMNKIKYFTRGLSKNLNYIIAEFSNLSEHQKKVLGRGLPKRKAIDDVKHILLVASGKGGVGKSTTSVNLATAMKTVHPERNIGLLDADIFGPSIPLMMNLHDTPLLDEKNLMKPLVNYGIQCMSMGFLIEEGAPVIWRGLMVMQAIDKLLRQVAWEDVDYLIVDTPPGTGDTHLSLIQNLPISGVLLVTTPQTAALQVTKRGAVMFQKLSVPLVGIVENMSLVKCPLCKNDVQLFGTGTESLASDVGCKVLTSLPLLEDINKSTDKGTPAVISNPDSIEANLYKTLAKEVVGFLENK